MIGKNKLLKSLLQRNFYQNLIDTSLYLSTPAPTPPKKNHSVINNSSQATPALKRLSHTVSIRR